MVARACLQQCPPLPGKVRGRRDEAGRLPSARRPARFPFTTKADLRETYPFGMFAVPDGPHCAHPCFVGHDGKPTVVGYTAKDIDIWL